MSGINENDFIASGLIVILVLCQKFDKETIDIEIKEYVFTDEILNGLYRILNAIKNNKLYRTW